MFGRDPCRAGRAGLLRAMLCGGVRVRLHVRGAPADALRDLAVGQGQDLLLRLRARTCGSRSFGVNSDGDRVVDELQLLQAQDRLAVAVEVEAVRVRDAVHRRSRAARRSRGR